jgi:hypothetical protein
MPGVLEDMSDSYQQRKDADASARMRRPVGSRERTQSAKRRHARQSSCQRASAMSCV